MHDICVVHRVTFMIPAIRES